MHYFDTLSRIIYFARSSLSKIIIASFVICALTACNPNNTATVTEGILPQNIEITGELVAAKTTYLTPPIMRRVWSYQVKKIAPEGSLVKKGDLIAQLDTSDLTQRLATKSARLATTKQDIETSKLRNLKQVEQLKLDIAEAKMNFDKAQLKFDLSDETVSAIDKAKYEKDAQIAKDNYQLNLKKLTLEHQGAAQRQVMLESDLRKQAAEVADLKKGIAAFRILAPKTGMLVHGKDQQGNKLKEGQSVSAGDAVASIPDLDHMQIKMAIPEVEAERVKLNQVVNIRLDANPERLFIGKIVKLGAVFRNKSRQIPLVVFDAIADIDEADSDIMRPGMTAKVSINITSNQTQLLLPVEALHYQQGQAYVYRPSLFGDERHPVEVSDIGLHFVALSSGLSLGDEVILP
ncbi:HlyD family efflux transporter periplasmic adaptor subunit [Parashewanella spongiae]|uniref:HlyD family efflux transporter periplasmic adaptor subunit n=1 Tax=Parashewanella spongiae TaxID=342950 RepID=A0A3A6U1M7_9GAMM|nr:efflux RND transporter periplasmic adaptor subunit [Parashewanella spongiae]MCL1077197.1 efflux RND transporter periplasmic adaptor subunit [Parashewanella spongiae]RJY19352.1 HlyD family efflux transporter periplasmic adaptor subunit [Parashewanella spongiae]